MGYTMTNNGFYAIDNFYVGMTIRGPTDEVVNYSRTTPVTIQRGATVTDTAMIDANLTYLGAHPGTYSITLDFHSEIAYGMMKVTISVPVSFSYP
jgi:hypothetical protein